MRSDADYILQKFKILPFGSESDILCVILSVLLELEQLVSKYNQRLLVGQCDK